MASDSSASTRNFDPQSMPEQTRYYAVRGPSRGPALLYFRVRVYRTPAKPGETGMALDRWAGAASAWVEDPSMMDYWWPGADELGVEEAEALGT